MEGVGQSIQEELLGEGRHLGEGKHLAEGKHLVEGRHSEVDNVLVEDKHLLAEVAQPGVVHLCLDFDIQRVLVHAQFLY